MLSIEKLFYTLILFFFLAIIPEILMVSVRTYQANQFTDYAVEQLAVHGGYNQEVAKKMLMQLNYLHINPSKWEFRMTEDPVFYPQSVSVSMSGRFKISSFGIFGETFERSFGDGIYIPISVRKEAISQVQMY